MEALADFPRNGSWNAQRLQLCTLAGAILQLSGCGSLISTSDSLTFITSLGPRILVNPSIFNARSCKSKLEASGFSGKKQFNACS